MPISSYLFERIERWDAFQVEKDGTRYEDLEGFDLISEKYRPSG
jgi:hypothetical protein